MNNNGLKEDASSLDFKTFVVHIAKYRTLLSKKFLNRKPYEPVNPKNICAVIPGKIRKIYVKKGSKITPEKLLIEIDAMKMYNKVFSSIKGKIKSINVKEGDKVAKNELLIEII